MTRKTAAPPALYISACDDRPPTGGPARSGPRPRSRKAKPNWRERNQSGLSRQLPSALWA